MVLTELFLFSLTTSVTKNS